MAHPPKPEKIWAQKINKKENKLAIVSGLAASANIKLVSSKHKVETSPFIIVNNFEELKKTKDVMNLLSTIMQNELDRCSIKKVRAGKGKMRGRKYSRKKGPLVIASKNCLVIKAAMNIPGVDAVSVGNLNAELLAPGAQPGRVIVTTQAAVEKLQKKYGE
jgi:large subunit ribosomal protein L4e